MSVKFSGNYVKENKSIYPVKSVVNIYIVYSVDPIINTRKTDFTVQNCLFGAVKLTKDVSTSNFQYKGYGICLYEESDFTFGNITNGKNVIIFGADMSFSAHERNRQNEIYVLGRGEIQGVTTVGPTKGGTTIYVEDIYKQNFTAPNKKFVLSLHNNGHDSYLFVNGRQELKFIAQSFTSNMKIEIFCIGNISSDLSSTNSTKTGFIIVYYFAVDYSPVNSV